jgi:hypothetical protein
MTTIACDGRTIAADTLGTCGSEKSTTPRQKIVVDEGHVYGFTGNWAFFAPARKWHAAGADPASVPKGNKDGDWQLLVFGSDEVVTYSSDVPYPCNYEYPEAFGSGATYALAAMRARCSAAEGVRVAIESDVYSGGHVRTLNLNDTLREAAAHLAPKLQAAE